MKNWKCIPLLVIVALMTPLALAGETLKVQVPFGFTAGDTTFPAGDYVVTMDKVTRGTVLIQGPKSAIVMSSSATGSERGALPALRFSAYGERRFLSAVQTASEMRTLVPSAQETELAGRTGEPTIVNLRAGKN